MKDPQVTAASVEPRIFLVSPILHCVSMTALVYLRSGFGLAYLRPKSLFFACSWAFVLYAIYAWIDGDAWAEYRAALWFGLGATALYWYHLVVVVRQEWNEAAAHDNFSGVTRLQRFTGWQRHFDRAVGEESLRLWGEPLVTLVVTLLLRVAFGEHHLSQWLALTALCLWIKEALNHWFHIRRRKRRRDILEDAEADFEDQSLNPSPIQDIPIPSARKQRVKRTRTPSQSPDEVTKQERYAEILRLLAPYDLAAAEENYHRLIKANHPDANQGSDESAKSAQQLNEAIAYFRGALPPYG